MEMVSCVRTRQSLTMAMAKTKWDFQINRQHKTLFRSGEMTFLLSFAVKKTLFFLHQKAIFQSAWENGRSQGVLDGSQRQVTTNGTPVQQGPVNPPYQQSNQGIVSGLNNPNNYNMYSPSPPSHVLNGQNGFSRPPNGYPSNIFSPEVNYLLHTYIL